MKNKILFIISLKISIILLITIIYSALNVPKITNFDECVAAGNPIMESYPRQCRDPISDKTFVEEVEFWELDGIQLMRDETEGFYGCFGCSPAGSNPALCIDPIMEMKPVEETAEKYCNSEFEVINTCSKESRNADACIEIYQPVCGFMDGEKIQCIRAPCANTYSNSCFACLDENVLYYTEGECQ